MTKYNINNYVTIYPTEAGWRNIKAILDSKDDMGFKRVIDVDNYINNHKTKDNGYRDQLWSIISNFSDLFFNGSPYLETTDIELNS